MEQEVNKREGFGSKLGFILSTIGFSVGVGTLWRFPYVCGTYGGGLYLLTYIAFMVIIGIPLFSAEVSIGLASRRTPVKAYISLSGKKPWGLVGVFNMMCIIFVIGYTIPVYGWILQYIAATAKGSLNGMNTEQVAQYFTNVSGNYPLMFFWIGVNILLTILVVKNSLQSGIEKISKVLLPSLAVIMVFLVIFDMRLDGAVDGLKFFFSFDFESFGMESILSALGQTFFSLGIAMAVGLVFGSYQKEGEINVVKNSTIITSAVIFVAVMAGMMIFPMVYAFGLEPQAGPGLTFIVMPNVFNQMLGGRILGCLFYIAFFIAAFSSGISGWETVIGFLMEQFNLTRFKAMVGTFLLVCVIGIPATLSDNLFNLFDLLTNNVFLTLGALFMSIFVGWIWGIDNFLKTAGIEQNKGLSLVLRIFIKYVAPVVILIFSLANLGII